MAQLESNDQSKKTVFLPPTVFGAYQPYFKRYLSVRELRRLHQSPGSPILEAVCISLQEPLAHWIPEDEGVDEYGFYEFIERPDQADLGPG